MIVARKVQTVFTKTPPSGLFQLVSPDDGDLLHDSLCKALRKVRQDRSPFGAKALAEDEVGSGKRRPLVIAADDNVVDRLDKARLRQDLRLNVVPEAVRPPGHWWRPDIVGLREDKRDDGSQNGCRRVKVGKGVG